MTEAQLCYSPGLKLMIDCQDVSLVLWLTFEGFNRPKQQLEAEKQDPIINWVRTYTGAEHKGPSLEMQRQEL